MIFSSRRFFHKTNEQIRLYYLSTCFCSFFGRKWRHQKDILKLTDLYWAAQFLRLFDIGRYELYFFSSSWAAYLLSTTHVWLFWRVLLLIIRQNYLGKIKERQKVFFGIIQAPTLKKLFCNPKLWLICLCLNAVWQKNFEVA